MPGSTIRTGLVGYGLGGESFHAPVITAVPGLHLAKVVERRTEKARQRYPWVETVRDVDELLVADNIDLVVITTPNQTHFPLAKAALEAGKHVVVDKPFTVTSAEACALAETARRTERMLTAYHNRRWDGDFTTLQQLLAGGELGRILEFESGFDRYRPIVKTGAWRETGEPGGGALYDLGVHLIDQALVLFGVPMAITAQLNTQRQHGIAPDYFHLVLHYDAHLVRLRVGMVIHEARPRFQVYGTEAAFVKHGNDPQEAALRSGLAPDAAGWGEEPPELWGTLTRQTADGVESRRVKTHRGRYQTFYEQVRDCLQGLGQAPVSVPDAVATIQLIELAMQSSAEQRTVTVDTGIKSI